MTSRTDGAYENIFSGLGGTRDRSSFTQAANGKLLTWPELSALYTFDGMAKRIINITADECLRSGYEIEGIEDDTKLKPNLEALAIIPKVTEALRWSSLYGGSIIVMIINDGKQLTEPMVPAIGCEIEELRVYDCSFISRHKKYSDPALSNYAKTEIYTVNNPETGQPYQVHESRCIPVVGEPLPLLYRVLNDGWGASKLQECRDEMIRYGTGKMWANALLERAQQAVYSVADLGETLADGPAGENLIKNRINLIDNTRSVNNMIVIDKEETYDLKQTSLAGVGELIDRFGLALAAVSGIPEPVLFGTKQAGLSGTGGAELEMWYGQIEQRQATQVLPILDRIITVQMTALGIYNEDYEIEFCPLYVKSDKENADIELIRANTRKVYFDMQSLDPSEVRSLLNNEGYELDEIELGSGPLPEDEPITTQESNNADLEVVGV